MRLGIFNTIPLKIFMMNTRYFYITVLSNWLLGFDRYQNRYSKSLLLQSTFPDQFYLLLDDELEIGIRKARSLLTKLNIAHDQIIRIETLIQAGEIAKNTRNGLGWVFQQNYVEVSHVSLLEKDSWVNTTPENLTAQAFLLNQKNLLPYQALTPRTLSILPVALACQARCRFCFSKNSISLEMGKHPIDFDHYEKICKLAKTKGAERLVITGGGEPGLLTEKDLNRFLEIGSQFFSKIVLISNGIFLSSLNEQLIEDKIESMVRSGLTTLALSYHHHHPSQNKIIMGVDSNIPHLLNVISRLRTTNPLINTLLVRLICVLQKTGIHDESGILDYLQFSQQYDVFEVCFKELYVASTFESRYANSPVNQYSQDNRVSLSVLTRTAENQGWSKTKELPWGSPIYQFFQNERSIRVAAYTEPSVGWERHHGIARSWNILSDGKCYATLEDNQSLISMEDE